MVRKAIKNILIISVMICIFIMCINIKSFALGDVIEDPGWQSWKPTIQDDTNFADKAKVIVSIVRTVGGLISIVSLMFIGIKMMYGTIEEKANYKKELQPWLIGAVMVFSISLIPTTIYEILNDDSDSKKDAGQWVDGYEAAVNWVCETYPIDLEKIEDHKKKISNTSEYWEGYISFLNEISKYEEDVRIKHCS